MFSYKNFNTRVTIHVLLIAVTSAALIWTLDRDHLLVTHISLAFLWVIEVFSLLYYVKRVNRELALFFEAIRFDDDSVHFNPDKNKPFKKLYYQFNRIIDEFSKAKTAQEAEHQYFINTVKHVRTGLISFDDKGEIEIYNKAAAELLNTPVIHKIRELNRVQEGFGDRLQKIPPDQSETIRLKINNDLRVLSVRSVEFKFESREVKLISLQNITPELEQGEIEAWQKLTRVMAHEIINSVSPVTLLSSGMLQSFEKEGKVKEAREVRDDEIKTSVESLKAIKKRSQGLTKFVESYRSIAKIPEPKLSTFSIKELFEQVHIFEKKDLESRKIAFQFHVYPESLMLTADEKLIEQVLINLVKNAMDALDGSQSPEINLKSFESEGNVIIKVQDNGGGIQVENIDNIFVPFFTTKDTGSGIGLSFSRQIMRAHKGKILVLSQPGETEFTLVF